jgi:hypothetical protein
MGKGIELMPKFRFAAVTFVAAALVCVAGLSISFAAQPAGRSNAMMMKDHIVVNITTTNGTTWGKVTADWMAHGKMMMGKVCRKAKCTYAVPHMTRVTLKETPTSPSTWPFKHWVVTGAAGGSMMTKKSKITIEAMGHKATAKAVFTVM